MLSADRYYSERKATDGSTLAARIAGRADAITAAARITAADAIKGSAPGNCTTPMYLPMVRSRAKPTTKPAATQIGRASVGKECRSRWSPDHEKKKREKKR